MASSLIGSANFIATSLKRSSLARCSFTASSTFPFTSFLGSSTGSCGRKPMRVPLCAQASP